MTRARAPREYGRAIRRAPGTRPEGRAAPVTAPARHSDVNYQLTKPQQVRP